MSKERTNKRINESKERALNKFYKDELIKFIIFVGFVVICGLAAVVLATYLLFQIWNYFNPTQDYLYFIAIYVIFNGIFTNSVIYAICESIIKKHINRKRLHIKLRSRQIEKYYEYSRKELLEHEN